MMNISNLLNSGLIKGKIIICALDQSYEQAQISGRN